MQKKFFLLFVLIIAGCEEISVIEENIPYEEIYIINGQIIGELNTVEVTISRSFRIEDDVVKDQILIPNLTAYIFAEDQGIWPLIINEEGKYIPTDTINVIEGHNYQLFVKIDDIRIHANTYVPPAPEIIDVEIVDKYVTCKIISNENVVYGCKYSLVSFNEAAEEVTNENGFFEVSSISNNKNDPVYVRTANLPDAYFKNPSNFILSVKIYAFDSAYKSYYETRENNKPIENIFSEGGGSVYWNVTGEKTIGLFIGYTITTINNIH